MNDMEFDKFQEGLQDGVQRGSGFWKALIIIVIVSAIVFVVLRMVTGKVADQRTRRMIRESMADDSPLPDSADDKSKSTCSSKDTHPS